MTDETDAAREARLAAHASAHSDALAGVVDAHQAARRLPVRYRSERHPVLTAVENLRSAILACPLVEPGESVPPEG